MLFSSWISSPEWFAMNWTQMFVWEHCGMLTLPVQVPVQPQCQKEKKSPTHETSWHQHFLHWTTQILLQLEIRDTASWSMVPTCFAPIFLSQFVLLWLVKLSSSKGSETLPAASASSLSDQTPGSLWLCILFKELFPLPLLINIGCQERRDSPEWLSFGHFNSLLLCIYKLFVPQYLLEGSTSLNFPIFEGLVIYFKILCYGMYLMDPQRE